MLWSLTRCCKESHIYISHMVGSDWLFFSNVGCMCLYQLSLGFYHNYLYSKQTKICQDDDHYVLEEQLKNFKRREELLAEREGKSWCWARVRTIGDLGLDRIWFGEEKRLARERELLFLIDWKEGVFVFKLCAT